MPTQTINIIDVSKLVGGDVLITFSDDTTVLFHAQFLYDVREEDGNVSIVDPFVQ